MSINEKTLEIAVTHEILSLAEKFIYSGCQCKPIITSRRHKKIPYVIGLTLTDEKRHGYDVKIKLPNDFTSFGAPYIYYLQFKKGYHKEYSSNPHSIFLGNNITKNRHIIFGINNNSSKDQHIKLRNLWNSNYSNSNVLVGYALPLISNSSNYKNCLGDLLSRTLIYEINDIDKLAKAGIVGEININESHHLAISYDGANQELRSTPQKSNFKDISIKFYTEVFSVRIYKILKSVYKNQFELPSHELAYITIDFIQNLFYSLNLDSQNLLDELYKNFQSNPKSKETLFFQLLLSELNLWKSESENFSFETNIGFETEDTDNTFLLQRRKLIFTEICKTLVTLVSAFIESEDFKLNDVITLNYLKPMKVNDKNEIEINFKNIDFQEHSEIDFSFKEINYTLI